MVLALGICGFKLPEIIDGGVFLGCEYVVLGDHTGNSIHSVWQKVKSRPEKKKLFLKILAEEIGRLHALGFVGVIASLNAIFVEMKERAFLVGYVPNGDITYEPGKSFNSIRKEVAVFERDFLSRIPDSDAAIFWEVYNEIV